MMRYVKLFAISVLVVTLDQDENMEDILEPEGILPRRTRGIKVDYTSKEALEKAGLKEGDASDEDE